MTTYIGTATSRIDGHAKVTGTARYAAEFNVPHLAHASLVGSTIARGRIARIDTSKAQSVAGVLTVLTHQNRPTMASDDSAYKDDVAPEGAPFRPLYDDRILFNDQPVALVVAEEPEIARFAASLVEVEYHVDQHMTDVRQQRHRAFALEPVERLDDNPFAPPPPRGRPEQVLGAAHVRHRAEYYVPIEHHNPMELYASTVVFEDEGRLTIYDKTQGVQNVQRYVASVFELDPSHVRVMSPFVGGAFGSGLRPQYQVVLAVLAALSLKRSVRLVLTRQQMYGLGYRPAMFQEIELGVNAHGALEAITHEATTVTSQHENFYRQETGWSGLLYQSEHARYTHKLARLDLATSCDMRAPAQPRRFTRWNVQWMSSRSPRSRIRWSFAYDAIQSAISTTTDHTAARACATAIGRAPRRSGGASGAPNRARCATAANLWAGAWQPGCGRRCRYPSPCA